MASDFFQQQDQARRRTGLLVVYFILALAALIGLVYLLIGGVMVYATPELQGMSPWTPEFFGAVAAGVSAVVGGASVVKIAQLSSGGSAVAQLLGGQLVPGQSNDPAHRKLLNVVEEMAIASGVPVPPVYVLDQEPGINAFAAGYGPADAVVGVSRGCLKHLTRDELQGVIAHEFSHILNGDMRLNIRLLSWIHGIMAIHVIGRVLLELAGRTRVRTSSRDEKNSSPIPLFLLGLGLYLLGAAGAFFGWLIQAAVSRQREFLADASAVQFTRNPDGIAGALKKIAEAADHSQVRNAEASEMRHMFFAESFFGGAGAWFSSLLATHPPLEERIRRLDPNYDPTARPRRAAPPQPRPPLRPAPSPSILPGVLLPAVIAGETAERVGTVAAPQTSAFVHAEIPPLLTAAVNEPFAARLAVYCLLLDRKPEVREAQMAHLQAALAAQETALLQRLWPDTQALPDAARLPLLDLAMPALRALSRAQLHDFRACVEALIRADGRLAIFEYALRCALNRFLDGAFTPLSRQPARGSPDAAARLVVSRLAWESIADEATIQNAFDAGMQMASPGTPAKLLPREECTLPQFDSALAVLQRLSPAGKRKVLMACAACLTADGRVTVREFELIRAVGAALDCPLPPLPPVEATALAD